MALFKILKGNSSALTNVPLNDGYAYFTPDDGRFYIDAALASPPSYYFQQATVNGQKIYRIEIESGALDDLDSNKKNLQSTVSDPTASGSGIQYISSITQNAQGVITATKSTVRDANAGQSGVVSTSDQVFAGSKTFNSALVARSDIILKPNSGASNDSGDIVWQYGNNNEKMRIWAENAYTAKSGPNFRVYKEDGTSLYTGTLPLADGTGASGTWGIHITGNAGSADAASIVSTKNAVAYYTDQVGSFGSKASANGALYATSANGDLQWGTLPVAQGGTGRTALTGNTSLRNDLGLGTGSGALAIANGGTGATTAADARTNLGLGSMATETAANYILKSTLSGAFDIMYSSAANTPTRLAANTTTTKKFLRMTGNGSAGTAPAWDTVTKSDVGLGNVTNDAQIPKSIGTAAGDIIYWTAASSPARLAKGSNGQVLKLANGLPSWGTDNDTKNTAGSTDTSSKIFLVGATSQAANPQTYSDNQVYATNGQLDANKVRVAEAVTLQYNTTTKSLDFIFA